MSSVGKSVVLRTDGKEMISGAMKGGVVGMSQSENCKCKSWATRDRLNLKKICDTRANRRRNWLKVKMIDETAAQPNPSSAEKNLVDAVTEEGRRTCDQCRLQPRTQQGPQ